MRFACIGLGFGMLLTLMVSSAPVPAKAQAVCQNGQCRYIPGQRVAGAAVKAASQAVTSTAQGVANIMARTGRMAHHGGNPYRYEGVGMGSTPEQARRNCCYHGQRPVADSGVAQGANGMWFACQRYW